MEVAFVYYVECVKVCFGSNDMRMELICEVGKCWRSPLMAESGTFVG